MKRFVVLLQLEIKKSLKAMPKLMVGAIIMTFIVIGIAVGANSLLNDKPDEDKENKIKIGVVSYDNSKIMSYAKSILLSTKSLSDTMELNFMEEEEALEKLKNNEVMSVMVIPNRAINDIMSGKNTPIKIIFPENAGFEAAVFQEIADCAVNILGSAQAGIYSVYDFYGENYRKSYIGSALDRLNEQYIKIVLLREGFFENTTTIATGDTDVIEYYVISGIILFLFLFGMNTLTFMERYKKEIIVRLKYNGVDVFLQIISRLVGISVVYFILSTIGVIVAGIMGVVTPIMSFKLWIVMIPIIVCISSIVLCINTLIQNKSAAIMFTFFISVVQAFVTGGLIPQVMLPNVFSILGKCTPAYYMLNQLKTTYIEGKVFSINIIIIILITLLVIFLSNQVMESERKERRA